MSVRRVAFSAGSSAQNSVLRSTSPIAESRIGTSGARCSSIGSGIGSAMPFITCMNATLSASPQTVPINASQKPSTRNCCSRRDRVPPIARRIAISRRRVVPRAMSSPATFAQAMSNTSSETSDSSAKNAPTVLPAFPLRGAEARELLHAAVTRVAGELAESPVDRVDRGAALLERLARLESANERDDPRVGRVHVGDERAVDRHVHLRRECRARRHS